MCNGRFASDARRPLCDVERSFQIVTVELQLRG
jgi:hypothetical protein